MIRAFLLAAMLCLGASSASAAMATERWETLPDLPAMPAAAASGAVPTNGARIHYVTYGKGPPVILLHGGMGNGDYWANQIAPLAQSRRVVVIDSRGHGRSTRDARPFTYELMADDVLAVMDTLRIRKASIVGWSDGAIIGLILAMKTPARIERVFAFGANMDSSGVNLETGSLPTMTAYGERTAADYARLSPTPEAYADFQAAMGRMWETQPNYKPADLALIRVPVAIVDGEHDEVIRPEHSRYLARTIPGAKAITLPGLSHFAPMQDPATFNAAMMAFLDGR
jgi:pimeloyl-ACP methyl ester carboxylesterase